MQCSRCFFIGIMCSFTLFFTTTHALEFLYPVGVLHSQGEDSVYVLYQKTLGHLELWEWDPITKRASKALLSRFTPAGLQVLPGNTGFSFIDNGRIAIKSFLKRSPKMIDIYNPLYNITLVQWITDSTCYFSAKDRYDRYSVFHVDIHGQTNAIAECDAADCMYPQKIGNTLFYIERVPCNEGHRHFIMQSPYPDIASSAENSFNNVDEMDAIMRKLVDDEYEQLAQKGTVQPRKIISCKDRAIAFLHMVSDSEGFVLEHPQQINRYEKTLSCSYYRLIKGPEFWSLSHLFTFEVPFHFLDKKSDSRLYESILPFLPRYIGGYLYYSDCSHEKGCRLIPCRYQVASGVIERLEIGADLFAPLNAQGHVFYGGIIGQKNRQKNAPQIFINNDGNVCIDLPTFL